MESSQTVKQQIRAFMDRAQAALDCGQIGELADHYDTLCDACLANTADVPERQIADVAYATMVMYVDQGLSEFLEAWS